jgi:hypothetical protein
MVATPEVFGADGVLALSAQAIVDFLKAFDRQAAPSLAIRAVLIWRRPTVGVLTQGLSLANGFTAGGPGLGDLPQKGPKDQAQVPTPVSRMGSLILLS